jgi:hypothetical protein
MVLHQASLVDPSNGSGFTGDPAADTYGHRRIISWVAFMHTQWTRDVARYIADRLPCPSQDTYHWYCAARANRVVRCIRFKAMGWSHWHTRGTREAKIAEAMA